jgi:HD domain
LRRSHRARLALRRLLRNGERLIVPPTTAAGGPSPDDFRRVVAFIAIVAVGFFGPSLVIAKVPLDLWLPFGAMACVAAALIAGSFFVIGRRTSVAAGFAFFDACIVAVLAWMFRDYYHQIGLLFTLLVAGFAVVHGFRASLGAVIPGALLIPLLINHRLGVNPTDPVYAFIYLLGASLVPWTAGRLARRRARALDRQLDATRSAEREAVLILARAAEAKDEHTGEHVARVGDLSARLARVVGMPEDTVDDFGFAAMLHDVGKLHVPDRILLKPGSLDDEEWAIMRRHTIWGEQILGESIAFERARVICRWHHENWDGSGYPDGLRGERIPLPARIVRLVDVFDALLSDRPYKAAWDLERCLEEIRRNAGRQFDPELVPIFLALIERTPLDVPSLGRGVDASPSLDRGSRRQSRRRPAGGLA